MAEDINLYYMEHREHRRIQFNRDVEVIGIGMFLSSSLSSGGLYLKTVNAFPVGTVVTLRFKLRPTDGDPMTTQACVVYVHAGVGVGFRFVDLNSEDHEKMVRFIEQYGISS